MLRQVSMRARDAKDRLYDDQIEPAGDGWMPPKPWDDGSGGDRRDAWLERGISDPQLGPNRSGRNG